MLTAGLLEKIGFTNEQINKYNEIDAMYSADFEKFAADFMVDNHDYNQVVEKLHAHFSGKLNDYTADLMYVLHCTEFARQKYKLLGFDEALFYNMANDIKYKLTECENYQKLFGIACVNWYQAFMQVKRLAIGRLQYDLTTYAWDEIDIDGFKIAPTDNALGCHIPSAGPLTQEKCIESYKMAYELLPQFRKNGVLIIRCASWLLYPDYLTVFGENSNTGRFARNFNVFDSSEDPEFKNCWRIFNVATADDVSALPSDTTMRRSFIEHIKNGGKHGVGKGVILFDGKNVLTNH